MAAPLLPAWRTASSTLVRCRRCMRALQQHEATSVISSRRAQSTSSRLASDAPAARSFSVSASTSSVRKSASFSTSSNLSLQSSSNTARFVTEVPPAERRGEGVEVALPRLRSQTELYSLSGNKKRQLLFNEDTSKMFVERMGLGGIPDLIFLDIYAGDGLVSQQALNLPNVKRVIAAEDISVFRPKMESMVEESLGRFAHFALDPFWWDTYRVMQERGLLDDVKTKDWDSDPTNFALYGILPANIHGERLIVQQLFCIAGQMWLYKFGRFNSYYLIPEEFKNRLMSTPGSTKRHKIAVVLEALVDFEEIVAAKEFQPQNDHIRNAKTKWASKTAKNLKFCLIKASPKKEKLLPTQRDLEALEFLARNLFIFKNTPWPESLKYIAPGAAILAEKVVAQGDYVDPKKRPRDLDNKDWMALLKAFQEWPFKPDDYEQADVKNAIDFRD